MLLGYLPTWAVYLTVYEKSKDFYETQFSKWVIVRGQEKANLIRRQLVGRQMLFFTDGWCLLDYLDKSDMGYKNKVDVTKQ